MFVLGFLLGVVASAIALCAVASWVLKGIRD